MAIPVTKPKALLADKGYDGDAVRENLLIQGILPIIPPKSNRREPIPCDFQRYRDRNRIERMFGQLEVPPRRNALRQNRSVLRQLPQPRSYPQMDTSLCQRSLADNLTSRRREGRVEVEYDIDK